MKEMFRWLMDEESGQGMVEYGVIVALVVVIALVVFASDGTIGSSISNLFSRIAGGVDKVTIPSP